MVLTTKSCKDLANYEKLELVGDAVLKMVQTDVLIKSIELTDLTANLH